MRSPITTTSYNHSSSGSGNSRNNNNHRDQHYRGGLTSNSSSTMRSPTTTTGSTIGSTVSTASPSSSSLYHQRNNNNIIRPSSVAVSQQHTQQSQQDDTNNNVDSSYPEIVQSKSTSSTQSSKSATLSIKTSGSSNSANTSHKIVWVRTDMVECIINNDGKLPKGWKPKKLSRNDNDGCGSGDQSSWGWCRAVCSQATSSLTTTPPRKSNTSTKSPIRQPQQSQEEEEVVTSPFQVKLRKVNTSSTPPHNNKLTPNRSTNNNSPWRNVTANEHNTSQNQTVQVNLRIDDEEWAPSHLQNACITLTYNTGDCSKVCTANDWWLQSGDGDMNEIIIQPPDDLCQLEQLHEPAVVYCLQRRYALDQIYTYTGKILLALNPFRSLDKILYGEHMIELYNSMPGGSPGSSRNNSPTAAVNGSSPGRGAGINNVDSNQGVSRPPPHIYAIAQDAYNSMMREMELQQPQPHQQSQRQKRRQQSQQSSSSSASTTTCNQSILVSGESGAGKTVTTKIIMQYLATLSQKCESAAAASSSMVGRSPSLHVKRNNNKKKSMEAQVLQSNPILESFGNARTVRNDNSSRFGKFTEMRFLLDNGQLVSASIETYLLEKVRLITQAPGERNYHIFYELLAGIPQKERRALAIGNMTCRDFKMTSGETQNRRDGVSDKEMYRELLSALDVVGFTPQEQSDMMSVCCALLHTSNLTLVEKLGSHNHDNACELDRSNPSLRSAVSLLGVHLDSLNEALCRCAIEARGEILYKNLSTQQAKKAVEALIKVTYDALFQYIVKRINESIAAETETDQSGGNGDNDSISSRRVASIGVLDIFGFETFDVNSFEQLCINYCNEALQQQFNRFVFKLEQQEYQREGIEWSFISFPDNQDVLDLIEKRHDGILSILDEQCRLARCTDTTFARAVYDKCGDHQRFDASNAQVASLSFAISHYAGSVEYHSAYFLEKNKDELPKETVLLLSSSSYPFLADLGKALGDSQSSSVRSNGGSGSSGRPASTNRKQLHRASSSIMRDSVGSQFSSQLRVLRTRIEMTEPHYVRCLKPNDDLVPHTFNASIIADQLRCAGVLEAIRVSRVGFPHRYKHQHFVSRYGLLLSQQDLRRHNGDGGSASDLCERLVEIITPQLQEVFGENNARGDDSTVISYNCGRSNNSNNIVFLGMQMGKSKVFLRRTAFEALEHLRSSKLNKAAATIQACYRMFSARIQYKITIYAITVIQSFVRCITAYRMARAQRIHRSSVLMQRTWRGFYCRRCFLAAEWIAWWCQSVYRGSKARQYCAYLFLHLKVSSIQRAWRKYNSTRTFRKTRRAIVSLQSRCRVRSAKRELGRRRAEARDVSKIKAERDEYREELLNLKMELEAAKKKSPPQVKQQQPQQQQQQTPPERPDRFEEVESLRSEVQRLQMELEKAHRMSSKDQAKDVALLIQELARREEEFDQLRREVESLRSRDDSFSLKTLTVPSTLACPSLLQVAPNSNIDSPMASQQRFTTAALNPRRRDSPVRSDVSLLDALEDDGGEQGNGCDPPTGENCSLIHSDAFTEHHICSPPFADERSTATKYEADGDPLDQLHVAIRQGNRELFDQVLRHSVSTSETCLLINQGDQYGRTALHLAALALRADMANVLVAKGAVVNAQDDDGETPLHLSECSPVTELLLKRGRANPNIPNIDGICAIHLAVQRRDIDSVRALLRSGANVNNADNVRWFTPLHLIALPASRERGERRKSNEEDIRTRIAHLLCGSDSLHQHGGSGPVNKPDLDYQDSQSNSPLHYAVQLKTNEASGLVNTFLENGANPNVKNEKNQSPLHLICHNGELRRLGTVFQDILFSMLHHGADPNVQSLTGCTPLHLSLYHKDIAGAVQLVANGAELHLMWKKPKRWPSFWTSNNDSDPSSSSSSTEVLALDMVEDERDLARILGAITKPSRAAPARSWCMACQSRLGTYARAIHCRHCSRLICGACASSCLPTDYFPKSFMVSEPSCVCILCERILMTRKDDISNRTTPTTAASFGSVPVPSSHSDEYTQSLAVTTATSSYGMYEAAATSSRGDDATADDSELFAC